MKKERSIKIPETTRFKLFVYPGKPDAISPYSTQYTVGFERNHNGYVSQTFLMEWSEDYSAVLEAFNNWKRVLE